MAIDTDALFTTAATAHCAEICMCGHTCVKLTRYGYNIGKRLNFKVVHQQGGWRSTNCHLNHIKSIHELQDIQPCPFNHDCNRDVGVRAGSVHLMYSNLEQKRGGRIHLNEHHQGCPFSTKFD